MPQRERRTEERDWRAEEYIPGVAWRVYIHDGVYNDELVADELTEAQAKLIAAAPATAKLCKELEREREEWESGVLQGARSAINAKAELCEELADALDLAWKEFNAIRARSGAPLTIDWGPNGPMQGTACAEEWWSEMTDMFEALLKRAGRAPE